MTCLDHLDTYQTANLNGVEFYPTSMTDQFGRRGPTHEYPDRDIPASEDLGRKAQRFSVQGYVAGSDHVAQAIALKAAAEAASPARLNHPIWGLQIVKIDLMSITHDLETEQRRSRISIDAVEFGGLSYPSAVQAIGSLIGSVLGTSMASIISRTQAAINLALPFHAISSSLSTASSAYSQIASLFPGNVVWNESTPDIYAALSSAAEKPDTVVEITDLIVRGVASLAENAVSEQHAIDAMDTLMSFAPIDIATTGSHTAAQVADNRNAIITAVRATAAAYAAQAAAESMTDKITIQTSGQSFTTIAQPDLAFSTAGEVLVYLDRIVETLDIEIAIAQQRFDDDLSNSLRELLSKAMDELSQIAYTLPTRYIVDVCRPLPSLVATHRATGDARRVLEVEQANPGRSRWFMRSTIETRQQIT